MNDTLAKSAPTGWVEAIGRGPWQALTCIAVRDLMPALAVRLLRMLVIAPVAALLAVALPAAFVADAIAAFAVAAGRCAAWAFRCCWPGRP